MAEKFEEKTSGEYDAFEKKGELYVPKEERGHIRSAEEVEKARELIPEDKKIEGAAEKAQKAEDWRETFYKMGGTRGKEKMEAIEQEMAQEKKAVESAKIPKEGIKTEEVLKEAGIQKPAESYKEVQERLAERLDKGRTFEGKKLSEKDKFIETRKFYLEELGYQVKYKGLLLDKAEILDENGKSILGYKGKPLEFKSFYFSKTEAQINNVLKWRLQEKVEGKPAKKTTEEQKLEKGYQNTVKAAENAQAARESKISFLQNVKTFGKEKWGKLMEGVARLNLREKIGMGFKEGKRLAIEGGKDLAAIGLTPLAAIEQAAKKINPITRIELLKLNRTLSEDEKLISSTQGDMERTWRKGERMGNYEKWFKITQTLQGMQNEAFDNLRKTQEKIYQKGRILRFLEARREKI